MTDTERPFADIYNAEVQPQACWSEAVARQCRDRLLDTAIRTIHRIFRVFSG